MAVIARGGLYKAARLFIKEEVDGEVEEAGVFSRALDISAETMAVVGIAKLIGERGGLRTSVVLVELVEIHAAEGRQELRHEAVIRAHELGPELIKVHHGEVVEGSRTARVRP